MKIDVEVFGDKEDINLGDVIITVRGVMYLVVEGDYSDEIMLVDLNDFETTGSHEELGSIIDSDDIARVFKSADLVLSVRGQ